MSEDKIQNMAMQAQMLEQHYVQLVQHEESAYRALAETGAAIDAARGLGENADSEALMPIGHGTFVKVKLSSSDKMVLSVGAGVAIEKSREYVINYLETRLKEIETNLKNTAAKREQAGAQLESMRQHLAQMTSAPPKQDL